MLHRILATLLLLALTWPVQAEQNVNPGINRYYTDPDVSSWVSVFERDGREIFDRRHDILAAMQVRPGMTVADIGAGTGFFALLLAEAVGPEGKVYAVDISPGFLEAIARRAQSRGLDNVVTVLGDQKNANLPRHELDRVYIGDTYHHFEYPVTYSQSIASALRPDGQVIVVDFKRIPGISSPWVMGHVRAGKETFVAEMNQAGLVLLEDLDFMQTQYFLRLGLHGDRQQH
jgi:precorrin-6B methylase 2